MTLIKKPTGAKRIATAKGVNPWGLAAFLAECLTAPLTNFFDPNGNPRPLDQIPARFHPMITRVAGAGPRLVPPEDLPLGYDPAATGPESLDIIPRVEAARLLVQLAINGYVAPDLTKPVPADPDEGQYSNVTRANEFLERLARSSDIRRRRGR